MTSNLLDSFWCTSAEEVFLGKVYLQKQRKKNTRKSETKSSPLQLKLWQRVTQKSSLYIWTTAEASNLKRNPILVIWESYSKTFSTVWAMNMISSLTGWLRSKTLLNPLKSVKRKRRMRIKTNRCKWQTHLLNHEQAFEIY